MIRRDHPRLSLSRQCRLLSVSRSSLYHRPKGENTQNLGLMRRIDELFLERKEIGTRSDEPTDTLASGRQRPSPDAVGSWGRLGFTNEIRSRASLDPLPLTQVSGAENVLSEVGEKGHP